VHELQTLLTVEIMRKEAMALVFVLDNFNVSFPPTILQFLVIVLSHNIQIVFLSYEDQHPLTQILQTGIHPWIIQSTIICAHLQPHFIIFGATKKWMCHNNSN